MDQQLNLNVFHVKFALLPFQGNFLLKFRLRLTPRRNIFLNIIENLTRKLSKIASPPNKSFTYIRWRHNFPSSLFICHTAHPSCITRQLSILWSPQQFVKGRIIYFVLFFLRVFHEFHHKFYQTFSCFSHNPA